MVRLSSNDDGQRQDIMLCLGNHIGGDIFGVGGLIGDDEHLRGTGNHIDAHLTGNLSFGLGHPLIAGTDDNIHGCYTLRAEGKGTDSPG